MSEEIGRLASSKNIRDPLFVSGETADRNKKEIYEFGPFRLEPAERKFLRGEEVVALTPKVFDMLVMLVRNNGHLLDKAELIRSLWPDSFVEEGNLSNNIFVLRKALGDDHEYIETVPRRGYRFVGAVRQFPGAEELPFVPLQSRRAEPADQQTKGPVFPRAISRPWGKLAVIAGAAVGILAIGTALWWRNSPRVPGRPQWVQLTNFPDSVSQPALSSDGRMLAFVRGPSPWIGSGEVYVKLLPDAEPVQLTHDALIKGDPTFSPDRSRIAYTVVDPQTFHWDTWVVPTLGGEPRPLLRNASGLTWTGPQEVLYSEIKSGVHMGIVTSEESRLSARDIYLPRDERAMAHRSYLSPDKNWILLVEMDQDHVWLPCRLVPAQGRSEGRRVGPQLGSCTSAAWSSDGKWMYFTSNSGGTNHIWRQRFPHGQPEQFIFGPTEQDGIAISADGHSLVTSVALQNTSLWIHDAKGEREISLEGNGTNPKFTPDGKSLCYLIVKEATSKFAWFRNPGELRIANLESGQSEVIVRGFEVHDYDISPDGKRVVMWIIDHQGKSRLWLADLDRSSPPAEIPNVEGVQPRFGPGGDVLFRHAGSVFRVHPDGTGLRKALAETVFMLLGVSPDGKWIAAWAAGRGTPAQLVFPLDGGRPVVIGGSFTFLSWSLDGRSVLLGGSYLVPLPPGASLPPIPEGGFRSEEEIARLPGARRINENGLVLGPSADLYAFYRGTVQRNLYSIPIP